MVLRLLRWISASHLRHAGIRSALSFFGIVLGVAVFGAIRIASESAQQAFHDSAELIGGTGRLVIGSSGGGVPEAVYPAVRAVPGVHAVIPVMTRFAPLFVRSGAESYELGAVKIIGTDLLAEPALNPAGSGKGSEPASAHGGSGGRTILGLLRPGARVLASASVINTAARLVRDRGDGDRAAREADPAAASIPDLELGIGTARVPLTIEDRLHQGALAEISAGMVLVADIANMQELFGAYGAVDQLLVVPASGVDREELRQRLNSILPSPVVVEADGAEARHAEKITAGFRLNLNFLAAISLLVSMLLIYNSVSYEVLRRRKEIGILQSIGVSRASLCLAMIAETAATGLAGAVCGTVGAYFLSSSAVTAVTRSISTLYLPLAAREVTLPLWLITECLLIGVVVAALGAALPSIEIFSIPPRERFGYQSFEQRFARKPRGLALCGAAVLIVALVCAGDAVLGLGIYAGFLTPTFFLLGTGLMVPLLLVSVLKLTRDAGARMLSVPLLLAVDHIRMTLRRSSVAVGAVIVSLGLYAGVTTMIASFRSSVEGWIHHITKADLFVSAGYSTIGAQSGTSLPEDFVRYVCSHPLVATCDWVMAEKIRLDGRDVRVTGTRLEILKDYDRLLFLDPMTRAELERLTANPEAALVSETFANKSRVRRGDTIVIPAPTGPRALSIANVFYDYSSDQGVVMIADDAFASAFGRSDKSGVSLYLRPGAEADAAHPAERVEADIRARFPQLALTIRSNSALRSEVLRVFDETFAITYALEGIALLIAFLTLAHAITMLTLERKRELGVMRAIGASRRALTGMVASESLLLGVVSLFGAIVVGGGLSIILVEVVNRFFFGWSVGFSLALTEYLNLGIAVLVVACAAGAVPGWIAARGEEADLRYE